MEMLQEHRGRYIFKKEGSGFRYKRMLTAGTASAASFAAFSPVSSARCSCGYSSQKTSAVPAGVAAFHYIHLAYGSVIMFLLLSLLHVREKSSSTFLIKNRPTIFIRSKFVIYFSTFCPNVEVPLYKFLQRR